MWNKKTRLGEVEQIECETRANRVRHSRKMTVDTEPDSAAVDVGVDDEADLSERPVSELKGADLEYPTCTPETRASKEKNECIFCGKAYSGTLREIRCHMVELSPDSKPLVAKCRAEF